MKIANFLVQKEELNEADLDLIVSEINKQEGEFKDRRQAKHRFADYTGKHKFHKHTKESNILDSLNKNLQRSGSFLLQSSSEIYKPHQPAVPKDSQTDIYRVTSTHMIQSEQNLPGSVRDQTNLPSQKQLTVSSNHKDKQPHTGVGTSEGPIVGRRGTGKAVSTIGSVSGKVETRASGLGSREILPASTKQNNTNNTMLVRIRSKEYSEPASRKATFGSATSEKGGKKNEIQYLRAETFKSKEGKVTFDQGGASRTKLGSGSLIHSNSLKKYSPNNLMAIVEEARLKNEREIVFKAQLLKNKRLTKTALETFDREIDEMVETHVEEIIRDRGGKQ